MALRIAAHAYTLDGVRKRGQRIEKVAGVAESAYRDAGVAADDERFVDVGELEALQDPLEMIATAHHTRGKVQHDGEARGREVLGRVE